MNRRIFVLGVFTVAASFALIVGACDQPTGSVGGGSGATGLSDDVRLVGAGTFEIVGTIMENPLGDGPVNEGDEIVIADGITVTVDTFDLDEENGTVSIKLIAQVNNFVCDSDADLVASGTVVINAEAEVDPDTNEVKEPDEMDLEVSFLFTLNGRAIEVEVAASVGDFGPDGPGTVTGTITVNGVAYDLADFIEQMESGSYSLSLHIARPSGSREGNHRLWVELFSDSGRNELIRREGPMWLGPVTGEAEYENPSQEVHDLGTGSYYISVYVTIDEPEDFRPAYYYHHAHSVSFDRNRSLDVQSGDLQTADVPADVVSATASVFNIVGEVMENMPDGDEFPDVGEQIYPNDGIEDAHEGLEAFVYSIEGIHDEPVDGDEISATIELFLSECVLWEPEGVIANGMIEVSLEAVYPHEPHKIGIRRGPTLVWDGWDEWDSSEQSVELLVVGTDMGEHGPETFTGTVIINGMEYGINEILASIQ